MKCSNKVIAMTVLFVSMAGAAPAPEFTLSDLSGTPVSLSSFKGKVVLIDFWAIWCHACKEAFPRLNSIRKEYNAKGVVVLGVNLDNAKPDKVASFVRKAGIDYTVLTDPKSSTARLFGIKGVPSLVVIGRDLELVKTWRGMSGATEKEIDETLRKLTASP